MGKYKLEQIVWVMFRNGDKIGYVPAKGFIDAKIIGDKYAFGSLGIVKEYSVSVAPHISAIYDEHEIFESKEKLFEHLNNNVVDR